MYQKLLKDIPGQVYTAAAGYLLLRFQYPRGRRRMSGYAALSMTIDRRVMAEKVLGTGHGASPDVTAGFTRHSLRA